MSPLEHTSPDSGGRASGILEAAHAGAGGRAATPGAARYVGRFAPSPTGPLHAGSLVAALASWLDARAHGGRWTVRIEDVDTPRCSPEAARHILSTLDRLGLVSDAPPTWQSRHEARYAVALQDLVARGLAYPCACTRKEIADSLLRAGETLSRHGELAYPGTCRAGLPPGRAPRAWRLRVPAGTVTLHDRLAGPVVQDVSREVGDFVLKRADGLWAYQLAVVVDDAHGGVTDVVRGADLLSSTPRQALLHDALGLRRPRWLHVPVVTDAAGEKLSKQTGAQALEPDTDTQVLTALREAGRHLGLRVEAGAPADWLSAAVMAWRDRLPRMLDRAGAGSPRTPTRSGAGE